MSMCKQFLVKISNACKKYFTFQKFHYCGGKFECATQNGDSGFRGGIYLTSPILVFSMSRHQVSDKVKVALRVETLYERQRRMEWKQSDDTSHPTRTPINATTRSTKARSHDHERSYGASRLIWYRRSRSGESRPAKCIEGSPPDICTFIYVTRSMQLAMHKLQ